MSTKLDTIRVLHVDDEPDFADMAGSFLERENDRFEVETATSASEGLDRLADHDFDCVVSDHDMPGQNGIEFLEAVREEYPDLPFVLYTGKGSEEVASDAISAGVTDYLQKGSGTDQYTVLANRVSNAVSAHRATAEAAQIRQRLEQILKTVPACIVQLNYDGEFTFANERAVDVLGLEQSDVTERTYNAPEWNITDLNGEPIPDEELPFRQVRDSGEPLYGYRHTIEWPDGTRKVLLVNGEPLFDDDETVQGVVFALSDITDEWEHQTRLQQATARLEALFERSPNMIDVHDSDGTIVDVNPRLCEETGYEEDELLGMKVWELDTSLNPEEARKLWDEMGMDERRELEGVYRRPDGSTFPIEVHIRRIDVEGNDRFIAISRKVTDQNEPERELESERDFINKALDALNDLFYVVGTDGNLRRWNEQVTEVTGYTDNELAEMEATKLFPEDEESEITDAIAETLTTGEAVVEAEIQTADGERIPHEFTGNRLTDPSGDLIGLIGIGREITERKEREQEQEQRYEAIFNQTYQFAGLMDPDGTLLEANETALEFGGLDEKDVIGKPFWQADWWQTDEETKQQLREAIDRASDGEFVRYDVEVQGEDENITIDFSIRPVTDESGDVICLIPEGRNITELKSLRQRERELERQNKRFERFATVVSHDLRNPLNVAEGRLELAREECDSEQLEAVARAHSRMEILIEELLTLAREGEEVTDEEPVDLTGLVEHCWQNVETAEATLVADTDQTVRGDQSRLAQLLENLFRNAVEHGGQDVRITVSDLDDGFYVADDGAGIPEDEREQIFESGYSTSDEGTGFGLAIVREIVEAHDWAIRATESDAGGARFEITGVSSAE